MKTCLHNSLISVSSNGDKCHERGRKSVYVGNVAVILRRGFLFWDNHTSLSRWCQPKTSIFGTTGSEIPRFLQNSNIKYRLVKRKEVVLVQIQLKHRGRLISVDHLCDFQTFWLIAGSSGGLLTHPGKKKGKRCTEQNEPRWHIMRMWAVMVSSQAE